MSKPLNQDKIKELNSIASIQDSDEKQKKFNDFLETLSEEEVDWLREQQGNKSSGECPFCLIAEGKIESKRVYEDDYYIAVLDIRPANKGHILILPKKHIKHIYELDSDIFEVVKRISEKLIENGAEGINMFIADGMVAGARVDHLIVHLIPRHKGDGLSFEWKGSDVSEEEMREWNEKLKIEKKKIEQVVKELEDFEEIRRIPN